MDEFTRFAPKLPLLMPISAVSFLVSFVAAAKAPRSTVYGIVLAVVASAMAIILWSSKPPEITGVAIAHHVATASALIAAGCLFQLLGGRRSTHPGAQRRAMTQRH